MHSSRIRVAVVQSGPILFDKQSAIEKILMKTRDAAEQGANLVVFPEAFLPGYPRGLYFGTRVGSRQSVGRRDWQLYWDSAITVPGAETDEICHLAREANVYLVLGVVERDQEFSTGTLYNSIVYIGPNGDILGKHRKLVPTGSERLLWGQGDGSTLTVINTPFGRIGGLICWENYMPLARMAMYAQGIDILITPTADDRETWQATLRHIACEGRCFVISCNQYVTKDLYPTDIACYNDIEDDPDILSRGGSAIVGPLGEYIVEPLYNQEGILMAELDHSLIAQSRFDFDVTGHYSRPDVFQLLIHDQKRDIVRFTNLDGVN